MPRAKVLKSFVGSGFSCRKGEVIERPGEVLSAWARDGLVEILRGAPIETPERGAQREVAATPSRQDIADWAESQGIEIPKRGRISASIVTRYLEAQGGQ